MSTLVNDAFDTPSIHLGEKISNFGMYAGGILPHIAVPDATFPSEYARTNGEVYLLEQGEDAALIRADII